MQRDQLIGYGVFDLFPDNPGNNYRNSEKLRESFMKVIARGRADNMQPVRYDVFNTELNHFEAKYWSVINYPFMVDGEVKYIINAAADLTAVYKLGSINY